MTAYNIIVFCINTFARPSCWHKGSGRQREQHEAARAALCQHNCNPRGGEGRGGGFGFDSPRRRHKLRLLDGARVANPAAP